MVFSLSDFWVESFLAPFPSCSFPSLRAPFIFFFFFFLPHHRLVRATLRDRRRLLGFLRVSFFGVTEHRRPQEVAFDFLLRLVEVLRSFLHLGPTSREANEPPRDWALCFNRHSRLKNCVASGYGPAAAPLAETPRRGNDMLSVALVFSHLASEAIVACPRPPGEPGARYLP